MLKKVCLITGATSGLGKCLSLKLCRESFKLILVSKSKGKLKKLSNILGKKNTKYFVVDLSNIEEVKKFVRKISSIDILINNAGGFYLKKKTLKVDKTIMLNYYAPYFLMYSLILKKKINKKFVINISSSALPGFKFNILNLNDLSQYYSWEIYKISKLLMTSITNYFSKLHHKVKFISYDPGRMRTNFGSNNSFFIKYFFKMYLYLLGRDPNLIVEELLELIKKRNKINTKSMLKNNSFHYVFNTNFQKSLFAHTNKVLKINKKKSFKMFLGKA